MRLGLHYIEPVAAIDFAMRVRRYVDDLTNSK